MKLVLTHEPRVRRTISIDKIATEIAPEKMLSAEKQKKDDERSAKEETRQEEKENATLNF